VGERRLASTAQEGTLPHIDNRKNQANCDHLLKLPELSDRAGWQRLWGDNAGWGFKAQVGRQELRMARKSPLKGGCRQDCLLH
jgi:hypothetical protein